MTRIAQRFRQWRKRVPRQAPYRRQGPTKADLREFVYLDEVSLRSLLSSLQGDLRDGGSEEVADAREAEVSGTLKAGHALAGGEAAISSRFQTTNSSTIQTSRKATVQSWFRDLRAISGIWLIEATSPPPPAPDQEALLATTDKSLLVGVDDVKRGELVEFRVRLAADPVYRLSTMVTELAGIAEHLPDTFDSNGALASLRDAAPVNRALERLLAGLIPVRAEVIDRSLVTIAGERYVVHSDLLGDIPLTRESLHVVGLTEHMAYWKDLRRVLFSDAEVTVLGRVARTGIQSSWTPVKLADLFSAVAPDLVEQINAASKTPLLPRVAPLAKANELKLAEALETYAAGILKRAQKSVTKEQELDLAVRIAALSERSGSASEQRTAFGAVRSFLADVVGAKVGPKRELALRERARERAGLPLFPSLIQTDAGRTRPDSGRELEEQHLIDVEVIAIYW